MVTRVVVQEGQPNLILEDHGRPTVSLAVAGDPDPELVMILIDVLVHARERCVEQSEFIDVVYRLPREVGELVIRLQQDCLRSRPM